MIVSQRDHHDVDVQIIGDRNYHNALLRQPGNHLLICVWLLAVSRIGVKRLAGERLREDRCFA